MENRDKRTTQSDSKVDAKLLNGLDTRLHVAIDFGASFIISGILAIIFRSMTAPLERIKLILQTQVIPSGTYNHIILPFLTGGSVGATSTMILYPLNFCNTRISVDVGDDKIIKREFSNLKDCLTKVYKNDGYRGFYQGSFYMAIAHSSYRSVYFGGYTIGKRIYLSNSLQDDKNSHTVTVPFLVSLLLAQSSSWAAIVVAYPFDTLARQKMLWSGRNAIEYPPMRHVMNNIIAKDGLFGFYKGVQANLMTTICGSSVLVTYDIVKFRFDKLMESYSKG